MGATGHFLAPAFLNSDCQVDEEEQEEQEQPSSFLAWSPIVLICIIQVGGTQAGTWPDKLVLRPGLCRGWARVGPSARSWYRDWEGRQSGGWAVVRCEIWSVGWELCRHQHLTHHTMPVLWTNSNLTSHRMKTKIVVKLLILLSQLACGAVLSAVSQSQADSSLETTELNVRVSRAVPRHQCRRALRNLEVRERENFMKTSQIVANNSHYSGCPCF